MRIIEGNFKLDKVDEHYVLQAQCQTFIGHNITELFMSAATFAAGIESQMKNIQAKGMLGSLREAEPEQQEGYSTKSSRY